MDSDKKGLFFYIYRFKVLRFKSFLATCLTKLGMRCKGINFGNEIIFYGIPLLFRMHKSRISIGNNCSFRSDFSSNLIGLNRKCILTTLRSQASISIGNKCGFSATVIASSGKITIGDNVLCGANVTITDFDWHGIQVDKRNSTPEPREVIIDNNVWIGLNCVILKGVRIGKNSVIGANSVVTKDIPENVVAAGNPCKIIKEIINNK